MMKSRKMSKSTIALILLSIVLALSLAIGLTGAWFTDTDNAGGNSVSMKFGTVDYALAAETTVKNGEAECEKDASGNYLLTAASVIKTGITITNTSTVATYYVLAQGGKYYKVDSANKTLVEVSALQESDKLAANTSVEYTKYYKVKDTANNGTAEGAIWSASDTGAADSYSDVTLTSGALAFGANVDLGLKLVNGTYELRAVQAANMTAAEAYTKLTTGWATING